MDYFITRDELEAFDSEDWTINDLDILSCKFIVRHYYWRDGYYDDTFFKLNYKVPDILLKHGYDLVIRNNNNYWGDEDISWSCEIMRLKFYIRKQDISSVMVNPNHIDWNILLSIREEMVRSLKVYDRKHVVKGIKHGKNYLFDRGFKPDMLVVKFSNSYGRD